jgi:amino acid transporter
MSTAKAEGSGLRSTCLSFLEVLSQSVANISPTLTPVVIVPFVFASAGNGTWLTYLVATAALMLVGLSITEFAKRSASPGALYVCIGHGLGPSMGFIAGWCLILAYIFTAISVLAGAVNYAIILLGMLNLSVPPVILFAIGTFLAWFIAYKDIKLSTRLMLLLEAGSMALILLVCAVVFFKRGTVVDPAQLKLEGLSFDGFRLGLILAIFSFVGYESSTALGDEAKRPLVFIPRAVLFSALTAGIFFVFTAYTATLGFQGLHDPLDKSTAPFNDLANNVHLPVLGVFISIGAVVSMWACTLASLNAASRVVFTMGRHGIVHDKLGQAHGTNETPYHAVTVCSLITFLCAALFGWFGLGILDIFNDFSTIATFGFLIAYIMVSVAAPVYLKSLGALKPINIVVSSVSVVLMLLPLIAAVYPVPAPPADKFPIYFGVYLLVGIVWFAWLRFKSSHVTERIRGDLKSVRERFAGEKQLAGEESGLVKSVYPQEEGADPAS